MLLLPVVTARQPARKGGRAFERLLAQQQAVHTNVFIQARPMDAVAGPRNLEVAALFGCGVGQARIPDNGNRDRPAILQVYR